MPNPAHSDIHVNVIGREWAVWWNDLLLFMQFSKLDTLLPMSSFKKFANFATSACFHFQKITENLKKKIIFFFTFKYHSFITLRTCQKEFLFLTNLKILFEAPKIGKIFWLNKEKFKFHWVYFNFYLLTLTHVAKGPEGPSCFEKWTAELFLKWKKI